MHVQLLLQGRQFLLRVVLRAGLERREVHLVGAQVVDEGQRGLAPRRQDLARVPVDRHDEDAGVAAGRPFGIGAEGGPLGARAGPQEQHGVDEEESQQEDEEGTASLAQAPEQTLRGDYHREGGVRSCMCAVSCGRGRSRIRIVLTPQGRWRVEGGSGK